MTATSPPPVKEGRVSQIASRFQQRQHQQVIWRSPAAPIIGSCCSILLSQVIQSFSANPVPEVSSKAENPLSLVRLKKPDQTEKIKKFSLTSQTEGNFIYVEPFTFIYLQWNFEVGETNDDSPTKKKKTSVSRTESHQVIELPPYPKGWDNVGFIKLVFTAQDYPWDQILASLIGPLTMNTHMSLWLS